MKLFHAGLFLLGTVGLISCVPRNHNELETGSNLQKIEFVATKTSILERYSLPVLELSGLSWQCGRKKDRMLLGIGDKSATLAIQTLGKNTISRVTTPSIAAQIKTLDAKLTSAESQFEAIACDKTSVFLLSEKQSKIAVLDLNSLQPKALIQLDVAGSAIESEWKRDDNNNNGEGMILLKNGHILIAKEKSNSGLIEFAPASETTANISGFAKLNAVIDVDVFPLSTQTQKTIRYKIVKVWSMGDSASEATQDLSELAVGPGGALYTLSDQTNSIAEVIPDDSKKLRYARVWKLPHEIEKAEGLVFDNEGHPYVGIDGAKLGAPNLYKLDLLTVSP